MARLPSTELGATAEQRTPHTCPQFLSLFLTPQPAFKSVPGTTIPFLLLSPEPLPRSKYLEGKRSGHLVVWYLDEEISGASLAWVARQPESETPQPCPRPLSCPTL